jgi:hypothetical protein
MALAVPEALAEDADPAAPAARLPSDADALEPAEPVLPEAGPSALAARAAASASDFEDDCIGA